MKHLVHRLAYGKCSINGRVFFFFTCLVVAVVSAAVGSLDGLLGRFIKEYARQSGMKETVPREGSKNSPFQCIQHFRLFNSLL